MDPQCPLRDMDMGAGPFCPLSPNSQRKVPEEALTTRNLIMIRTINLDLDR